MTNPNVRPDLEALRVLLANCPALPIVAKPQEHDDWGVIRSAERDGDGWQRVFVHTHIHAPLEEQDEHRRAKTDPTQETMDLIVGGLNALPYLIAHIERLQNALKPFAAMAEKFNAQPDGPVMMQIDFAHFRNARATLPQGTSND